MKTKIKLRRETLRHLEDPDLQEALGGSSPTIIGTVSAVLITRSCNLGCRVGATAQPN
jgi:hypothetical protein